MLMPNDFWPNLRENPLYYIVILIILCLLGGFLMTGIFKNLEQAVAVRQPEPIERSISVDGSSTVEIAPDIATISGSVTSKGESVEAAQVENTNTINKISKAMRDIGIADEDIQTASYSAYEDQVYNSETREYETKGWIVYQNLTIKVRDIDRAGEVLDALGSQGATGIYGPNFSIDDPEVYKDQARDEAIEKAYEQAEAIAKSLDIRLGDVLGYSEWSGGDYYYDDYYGYGGIAESAALETGSESVTMNVSITFELRQ
jgi:uncharacterized protein